MAYAVWIGFLVFILVMVLLDLGVFHRRAHTVSIREALVWTCVWVAMALVFNVFVYFLYEKSPGGWSSLEMHQLSGRDAATQFFTGYVLEKSLSMDNIFVIAMIFAYFGVPLKNQHRLLFWGILGAVVLRGVMIALGAALIARFDWIIYVFGGLLLVSAVKMMLTDTEEFDPERNFVVRIVRRLYPVTPEIGSGRFFVRMDGQWVATPLFLALVLVETSDVLFAVDSIPAVFAVTRDPFLVFTSNIFAILGLRSMYFVLAGFMHQFRLSQDQSRVRLGVCGGEDDGVAPLSHPEPGVAGVHRGNPGRRHSRLTSGQGAASPGGRSPGGRSLTRRRLRPWVRTFRNWGPPNANRIRDQRNAWSPDTCHTRSDVSPPATRSLWRFLFRGSLLVLPRPVSHVPGDPQTLPAGRPSRVEIASAGLAICQPSRYRDALLFTVGRGCVQCHERTGSLGSR